MSDIFLALLEIIKIDIPAVIVYYTVHTLLKQYLDKQYQLRQLEYKQSQNAGSTKLRLQAYERLSVLCERIAIPNLVLQLKTSEMTSADLKAAMLIAIQQEFEHNISQQIYLSDHDNLSKQVRNIVYPRSLYISLHSMISDFARRRQSLKSKCSQIREFVHKLIQNIDRSCLLFSQVVLSR